jgi:DNA-binding transcriptional regulator PaaX
MNTRLELILAFTAWGLETFSRRDCGLILAGARHLASERQIDRLLARLEQERLLERQGRGRSAKFRITAEAQIRLPTSHPTEHWQRPWDGKWRIVTFDLPVDRSRDRMLLWRAFRERKFGLLQRSVWIWPHEVETILQHVIQAEGVPECFCGLETGRVFLCTDDEIVATSWDWEEISRRHATYLKHAIATPQSLTRARDLNELGRIAHIERDAHHYAFSRDPLLPRLLWPRGYKGVGVEDRHQQFTAMLARRFREFAHD